MTHRHRIEKMLDERFPILDECLVVKKEVLDVLVWRNIRLGGFEDLALVIESKGGLNGYLDFELEIRERKIGDLAANIEANNDDDGHSDDGHGPDDDAANGKNRPKDDKTRGNEGKSVDGAEPSTPKGHLGGSKPMDLGDEVAKATNPAANDAEKSAEVPANEGKCGAAAESTIPKASTADLKDTVMEECVPESAHVSKHQFEQQQSPIVIEDDEVAGGQSHSPNSATQGSKKKVVKGKISRLADIQHLQSQLSSLKYKMSGVLREAVPKSLKKMVADTLDQGLKDN
ncbi:hypothetical protein ACS0TY_034473 [Phlomoides rotata]